MATILVTGGLGFIGSNFVIRWSKDRPQDEIIVLDAHTYAARPQYLCDFISDGKIEVFNTDIRDSESVDALFKNKNIFDVVHFAAESHVCNSIRTPKLFWETNVLGTFNVINAFYQHKCQGRFLHISTDEVFGELISSDPPFCETTPLCPRSPYAASKASSDMVVRSFVETYDVDAVIANCSNNYGPNQHFEKLIPKAIKHILQHRPVTIYGTGRQIRDWLFVEDACRAFSILLERGQQGERYCIGGEFELSNLEMVDLLHRLIITHVDDHAGLELQFTDDRPTDDFRYALNTQKIRGLGWQPTQDRHATLLRTIKWYAQQAEVHQAGL